MSEMKDLYEKALRSKYRFFTSVGPATLEDLWDLPLTALSSRPTKPSLNQVAQTLARNIKDEGEEDFVGESAKSTKYYWMNEQLEIVKHIIAVKKEEQAAAKDAFARKKEREELLELLHAKKVDELKGLSVEELERRVAQLTG